MLIRNEDVIQYLLKAEGKLVHLYGDPDAGRTQTVFSVLDEATDQDKLCCYWIPREKDYRYNVFVKTVHNRDHCIVGFPENATQLPVFLTLAAGVDLVCIDNFLEYICHKKNAEIRNVFASISAAAYKYKTNFVLVNDLRYLEAKGGLHPAYQEYFRRFCAKHIKVEKDSDFHISYDFCEA